MKKIFLILIAAITLSSCYTTFYPPQSMDMGAAETVPDSTRQIIINNYYETTEYYQIPNYRRYSLLWGDYYWDPFYYDYDYYRWRPYYWYGNYYYYNPHNHYWYYYDRYDRWDRHPGDWSGSSGEQERIHKPGYNVLMNSPTGAAPFVSVGSENNQITKPGKKVGVSVNSGITNDNNYQPQIQSVGKKPLDGNNSSGTVYKNSGTSYKPSSTVSGTKKSTSSRSYSNQKLKSNTSSSSSNSKYKSSSTNSTSSKKSSSESSSSTSKKSK